MEHFNLCSKSWRKCGYLVPSIIFSLITRSLSIISRKTISGAAEAEAVLDYIHCTFSNALRIFNKKKEHKQQFWYKVKFTHN